MKRIALLSTLLAVACGTSGVDDDDITTDRDGGMNATRDAGDVATRDGGDAVSRDGGDGVPRDGGDGVARDGGDGVPRDGGDGVPRDGGEMPRDAGMRPATCNPSFGAADACGGDPVGTWTYQLACTDQQFFGSLQNVCPGVQISNQLVATSGTVDLRADGTFTRSVSTDVTADSVWPQVCVIQIGNCTTLEATLSNFGTMATCAPSGGGCNCVLATTVGTFDNGNYVVNGGSIVAAGLEYWFCESAGVLEYRGTANNQTDNTFTFVLTP